jgi:acetyl-CoA carboxylase carboxyl transferase beta subunit
MGRGPVYDPGVSSGSRTRVASAWERAALVVDEGSLETWDDEVVSDDPLGFVDAKPYAERLAEARERTGLGEAVLTGRATLEGRPLVLVAGEFEFLGGSVGVATSERVARAFERAVEEGLPLVALTASGGSRMQEGTRALVGMAKLAAAAGGLRAAGLPYVVCLTDPTAGGVLASWGSLGTVTFALPGALAGFAGPRVVELLTGASLPEGAQRAEALLAHGLVDDVVEPGDLRAIVARVLRVTCAAPAPARVEAPSGAIEDGDAWASLQWRAIRGGRASRRCCRSSARTWWSCAARGTGGRTIPPAWPRSPVSPATPSSWWASAATPTAPRAR